MIEDNIRILRQAAKYTTSENYQIQKDWCVIAGNVDLIDVFCCKILLLTLILAMYSEISIPYSNTFSLLLISNSVFSIWLIINMLKSLYQTRSS